MIFAAVAMLAAAGPAAAPAGPPAPPADQRAPIIVNGQKSAEDRMVCISSVPTGSLMPQRTCHTAAEWSDLRDRGMMSMKEWSKKIDADNYAREKARMSPR